MSHTRVVNPSHPVPLSFNISPAEMYLAGVIMAETFLISHVLSLSRIANSSTYEMLPKIPCLEHFIVCKELRCEDV
jgi:hypothetical protein